MTFSTCGRLVRRGLLLATIALAVTAPGASAQSFAWTLPTGSTTWTPGTTHWITWTGGPAGTVNIVAIDMSTFAVVQTIASGASNNGYYLWNIPVGLPSGNYQVYIEDASQTVWDYSPTFTLSGGVSCAPGCALVSAIYESPNCESTQEAADLVAEAGVRAALADICGESGYLDGPSVIVEPLEYSPTILCPTGTYLVAATAVGCCCTAVPAEPSTWGGIKSRYGLE